MTNSSKFLKVVLLALVTFGLFGGNLSAGNKFKVSHEAHAGRTGTNVFVHAPKSNLKPMIFLAGRNFRGCHSTGLRMRYTRDDYNNRMGDLEIVTELFSIVGLDVSNRTTAEYKMPVWKGEFYDTYRIYFIDNTDKVIYATNHHTLSDDYASRKTRKECGLHDSIMPAISEKIAENYKFVNIER